MIILSIFPMIKRDSKTIRFIVASNNKNVENRHAINIKKAVPKQGIN